MKRPLILSLGIICTLVLCVLTPSTLSAQTSYDFSASSGTFIPLADATAVDDIESDDVLSSEIPIGFTFNFLERDTRN
jgi:hypothetical protein